MMHVILALHNTDPSVLPSLGPSKYIITDDTGKIIKGRIELVFPDEPLIVILYYIATFPIMFYIGHSLQT